MVESFKDIIKNYWARKAEIFLIWYRFKFVKIIASQGSGGARECSIILKTIDIPTYNPTPKP
jgi:hypothetical protein